MPHYRLPLLFVFAFVVAGGVCRGISCLVKAFGLADDQAALDRVRSRA